MKKNDIVTLDIIADNGDGKGIARVEGEVVFVSNALPGETVNAKVLKAGKNSAWAKTIEVLSVSPERIEPECPYYPKCGGCSYLHMSYAEELRLKLEHVNNVLKRIGGLKLKAEQIVENSSRFAYRNKAIFNCSPLNSDGLMLGFYRENSHDRIAIEQCLLQSEFSNRAVAAINNWAEENGISVYDEKTGKGLLRKLFTRENQICVIANGKPRFVNELLSIVCERLPECSSLIWSENRKDTNSVFGSKFHTLFGSPNSIIELGNEKFELAPNAFFQINTEQTERLYKTALEFANLSSDETALDLYCGVGTLTSLIAASVKHVTGVEVNPSAIESAISRDIPNADFICNDAAVAELPSSDCVFIDPPRKGLALEVIERVSKLAPTRIVCISCNPASLARDLKLFAQNGFKAVKAVAFDMFPATQHIETVVLLQRV